MGPVAIALLLTVGFAGTSTSAAPKNGTEKAPLIEVVYTRVGINISEIIEQAQSTQKGLLRLADEIEVKLEEMLTPHGPEVVAEAKNITRKAIARSKIIFAPVLELSNELLELLKNGTAVEDSAERSSRALAIIRLLHKCINLFDVSIFDLQKLAVRVIHDLQKMVQRLVTFGDKLAAAMNALIVFVLPGAAREVQPLLDLVSPLLQPKQPPEDLDQLTKSIFGLDIWAIISQTDASLRGLDLLFRSSALELKDILLNSGVDMQREIQDIIDSARAEAEVMLRPLTFMIELILSIIPERRNHVEDVKVHRDFMDSIIGLMFRLMNACVERFKRLFIVQTINRLIQVAIDSGIDTKEQVQELTARTMAEAKALIRPLLKLFDPIMPGSLNRIDEISVVDFPL